MTTYFEEEELQETDVPSFEPEPEEPARHEGEQTPNTGPDPRMELAVKVLKQVHETIGHVLELMNGADPSAGAQKLTELLTTKHQLTQHLGDVSGSRVLEGIFDGHMMVGSDGKPYAVPPNYASKSRLVEGDVMKLTIRPDGSFMYKQIGPIERKRMVGCLAFDASTGEHIVICGEWNFKVLPASVSYFHGEPGDEAVLLVPKSGKCVWAAVENIIKK